MNKIPSTWEIVQVNDVTIECDQRTPNDNDKFNYIDISSINRETKSIENCQLIIGRDAPSRARKIINTNDVLVALTRPALNAIALVPSEFNNQIASTGLEVIRALEINPRWLFYIFQTSSFISRMSELVQGALYPAVTSKDVRGFEFPLAPLQEQKRIIDKLDDYSDRIEQCRNKLKNVFSLMEQFRRSTLESVVSGEITGDWRISAHEDTEWKTIKLSELTVKVGSGSTPKGAEKEDEGIPFIRSMNVVFFGFKYEGLVYLSKEQAKELRNAETIEKDVLLNITGASIGRVTLTPANLNGARVNQHVCIIRPKSLLLPEYLCWVLSSPAMQQNIANKNYGATRQALTKQQILDLDIPLPSIEEQKEIIRRVEALLKYADNVEKKQADILTQVEQLMPSLLAKAFSGKLLPQVESDEPVPILLDRIHNVKVAYQSSQRAKPPKMRKNKKLSKSILAVMSEEDDWIESEEIFRRCGIKDGSEIETIEGLYAEMRLLIEAGRLSVKSIKDAQGQKQHDILKLV